MHYSTKMPNNSSTRQYLKNIENTSLVPQGEESDVAKYFNSFSFVPDVVENIVHNAVGKTASNDKAQASKSNDTDLGKYFKNSICSFNSRDRGVKSKRDVQESSNSSKRSKSLVPENEFKVPYIDKENISALLVPVSKSQISFGADKSTNKSTNKENTSKRMSGCTILSLEVLSRVGSQKKHLLSSWGLPPAILEVQINEITSFSVYRQQIIALYLFSEIRISRN